MSVSFISVLEVKFGFVVFLIQSWSSQGEFSPPLVSLDPLIPCLGNSFSHVEQQQGDLGFCCCSGALNGHQAEAQQECAGVPHGAGTALRTISMQGMVQAPSSVVTPKQLWFLQLHLRVGESCLFL